jgi:O-antigen/teichoic acid export membrane protein
MVGRGAARRVSSLLSGAIIVAIAGLIANVLNLAMSVLIARLLNPVDYGAYSQMVGIFFIVALPGSALSVAVVRRATYYLVRDDEALMARWQRGLNQRLLRWALGFALMALVGSFLLSQWLGHRSWLAVWINALAAIAWALLNVDRALMQSRQRYKALASNFLLEAVIRTTFVLLCSPLGVTGIVSGLLVAILVARWHARRLVRIRGLALSAEPLEHTGITADLVIALATLALLATLQFIDVFLVGRYRAEMAGAYSAISQVAKTIVYGAIILGNFLLPETAIAARRGMNAYRQLVIAGGLLLIPTVALMTASVVASKTLLTTVFGSRYATEFSSMTALIAAMVFLGGSSLLCAYLLGSGRRWPTVWLAVCTLVGGMYLAGAHGVIGEMVHRDLKLQIAVFSGLLVASLRPTYSREESDV